jgi:DMSO/TMAO reductase YedYZ molybdopterin-dependent catalytic subunit
VTRGWRAFWSGVGGGVAFVVVMLLGRVLFSVRTIPELIQDRLVLLLPGAVFSFFLDHLLYLGKPLLFGALLVLLIALAGLGGVAMDRMRWPMALPTILWLVIGLLVLPFAGQGAFGASPAVAAVTLLACAAYGLTFWYFAGYGWHELFRSSAAAERAPETGPVHDRRRFIAGGALLVAAVALAVRAIGKFPGSAQIESAAGGTAPASGGSAQNQGASPLAGDSASPLLLPPAVTPVNRFYVVSKNLLDPDIKSNQWALRVGGMVTTPLTLKYEDITAMPPVQIPRTLECISNEVGGDLISNGVWTGVRMADVLSKAGVQPTANTVAFVADDGFTSDMTLDQARDPATILAYQLNGSPLPSKHGYPVRVLAPGIYGMKNPKWVTQIMAVNGARPGYWQQQGWDEQGIVQTMATITVPANNASIALASAPVNIAGVAFAGSRGVQHVEVSVDGGSTWAQAELLPSQGSSTWTFWHFSWQPTQAGNYSLATRATDGTGTVQPSRRTDPFPDGATGYDVLRIRLTA